MKKIALAVVLVMGLGAYAFWSSSQKSAQTATIPATSTPEGTNPALSSSTPSTTTNPPVATKYKDGTYLGDVTNAFYGDLQVSAVIKAGKLVDVVALKFPNDRETSIDISNSSLPKLKAEAIAIQGSKVDIISGATQTSEAYQLSLESALKKARG